MLFVKRGLVSTTDQSFEAPPSAGRREVSRGDSNKHLSLEGAGARAPFLVCSWSCHCVLSFCLGLVTLANLLKRAGGERMILRL